VHAYCVAYSKDELLKVKRYAGTVIFNSLGQLERFHGEVRGKKIGLRINPQVSYSHYDLADPARRYSRLGVVGAAALKRALPLISGCMFHFNCENSDFANFSSNLEHIAERYGEALKRLEWVSFGGGIFFTKENYPVGRFCAALKRFAERFGLDIYLEPGEAVVTQSTQLVTEVLDIVRNGVDIAIVNASVEAHMLDHLVYRTQAKLAAAPRPRRSPSHAHRYMIAGRSCLAGDVFGTYDFPSALKVGSTVRIGDAGGYTMVKKNWFNGLTMPSIAVARRGGRLELIRSFDYKDFLNNLS
jgi:carboxynorspermidine decarboxylase